MGLISSMYLIACDPFKPFHFAVVEMIGSSKEEILITAAPTKI